MRVEVKPQREILEKYFDVPRLPHSWCPGCGIGTVLGSIIRAADAAGVSKDDLCIVTGIGCSGLTYNYTRIQAIHGTHGRALAFATGLKVGNPRLRVVVPMGDGDCAAIGGNHLIHAARRNIQLCAVVLNNCNYGMTGGQYSATTPLGVKASTAPYGNVERPMDIAAVAQAAGATYVARCTTYHVRLLINLIAEALVHKGFSLVEVLTQCPQLFGRLNRCGPPSQMLMSFKARSVLVKDAADLEEAQLEEKIVIGELMRRDAPEFSQEAWGLAGTARGRKERSV